MRPVLAKHGLAVVQGATVPMTTDVGALVGFAVETMLVHSSGEWLTNTAIMPIAKADPQGAGAALTYGRRYSLSALLSIATDEDDDGNAASNARQTTRKPATSSQQNSQQNGQRSTTTTAPNGSTPHARAMPIGKSKGKPLGEIDTDDLDGARKWCAVPERAERYKDLIADIDAVLLDRAESEASA